MLTPQEVSTRAFAKAMMGGYNMAAVDEFLDELTDDYTDRYTASSLIIAPTSDSLPAYIVTSSITLSFI